MVERRQIISAAVAITALSVAVGAQLSKRMSPTTSEPVIVAIPVAPSGLVTTINQAINMAIKIEAVKREATGNQEFRFLVGKDGLPIIDGENRQALSPQTGTSSMINSGSYTVTVRGSGAVDRSGVTGSGATTTFKYEP